MKTFLFCLFALVVTAIFVGLLLFFAPEGFEDEEGFHRIKKEDP